MKFMNMKRFGSIAMAGALALSLAIPAFATSSPAPQGQVTITGTYQDIPIAVSVPTTGTAQINPYGLPVTLTKSDGKTVDLVGQQITSKPLSIKNQGAVKLDVNASLAVAPTGSAVAIAATADTDKTIKVDLEVVGLDDEALAVANTSEKLEDMLIDKFAADATWASANTLAAPIANNGTAMSAITPAKSGSAMAVLGGVTAKSEGFTYGKDSIALFRLTGELAEEPNDGTNDIPWAATDGFSANIVFKFTPHVDVAASISLDKTTLTLDNTTNTTGTVKATFAPGDSGLTVTTWAWTSDAAAVAACTAGQSTDTVTVTRTGAGSANITVTATLSDNSTVTATCAVNAT